MTPEEELEYLYGVRTYVTDRIEKLSRKIKNDKRQRNATGHMMSYSGLFIQSDCLIPHIELAIADGDTAKAIAERAVVSHSTVTGVLRKKNQWMREEIAEKILLALNLPHVFNDIPKVRLKRKYNETPEPPYSHYEEE